MARTQPPPHNLPLLPPNIDVRDPDIAKVLLDARVALARLDGASFLLSNPMVLLSPFVLLRESLASSEIENIHTTISGVLESRLLPDDERGEADTKVLRYEAAIREGFEQLRKSGLTTRLVSRVHQTLLPNYQGEFRRTQNEIKNKDTGEIVYVPPAAQDIPRLISNWEDYLNKNDGIDPLIKAIVGHYQFEAIHPFGDGNGRAGRILLVFTLVHHNLLVWPTLYLSGYINANRPRYYATLRGVTEAGDWRSYLLFMLRGVALQADHTYNTFLGLKVLREELHIEIETHHAQVYSAELLDALVSHPIITTTRLAGLLHVHRVTASKYLKRLADAGLLETQKQGRHKLYINRRLIRFLQDKSRPVLAKRTTS